MQYTRANPGSECRIKWCRLSARGLSTARHPLITIVGCKKIGTHEQKDHLGFLEIPRDFLVKFLSGHDAAIMPGIDESLPL